MAKAGKKTRSKSVAIGYVRVSTEEQTQGHSLTIQEDTIKRYASLQHLKLAKVFKDPGVSGAGFDRPGLNGLRNYISTNDVKVLLVAKIDRLGRDLLLMQDFLEELQVAGVRFVSIDEGLSETGQGVQRSIAQILGLNAEMDRQRLIERVVPAMAENAKQGRMNGKVSYGYKYDPEKGKVSTQPEEAKTVRWLFREFAKASEGSKRLARRLANEGVRNRKNKPFAPSTLETMLRNEFYLGRFRWKQKRAVGTDKPVDIVMDDHHPALVDKDTFEKVQALLDMRGRQLPRVASENPFLLTGILVCRCGQRMKSQRFKSGSNGPAKAKYYCPARRKKRGGCPQKMLDAEPLDQQILSAMADHVSSERWREAIAKHQSQQADKQQGRSLARIAPIEQKLQTLLEDHLAGCMDVDEFDRRNADLQAQLAEVQKEVEEAAENKRHARVAGAMTKQWKAASSSTCRKTILALSSIEQRQLAHALIRRVCLQETGQPTIDWRFEWAFHRHART
jgi:site-specific DNA recombinase